MGLKLKASKFSGDTLLYLEFIPLSVDGTFYGLSVLNAPVTADEGVDRITIVVVDDLDAEYSETKTIEVVDLCDPNVLVSWIDPAGGLNNWVFGVSQEYSFSYENGKKAKRKRLFANNLTLNQWETINGLNTLGEIYRNNMVELTTSVLKTSSRIGQQVYATENDETVGVIVIPTENITNTRQVKHSIEITIEYPEIFLQ